MVKLNTRLMQGVYIIFILLIIVVSEVGINGRTEILRRDYKTKTETRAGVAAYFIEHYLTDYVKSMEFLAGLDISKKAFNGDADALEELVTTIDEINLSGKYTDEVLFIASDGSILGSFYNKSTKLSAEERHFIHSAKSGTVISDFIINEENSHILVSVPVNEGEANIGYMTMLLNSQLFSGITQLISETDEDCFLFYDKKGQCIASESTGKKIENAVDLAKLYENDEDSIDIGGCFIKKDSISLNKYNVSWSCCYVLSRERIYEFFIVMRLFMVLICMILLVLGFASSYVYRNYFIKPLDRLTEEIRSVNKSGNYKIDRIKGGKRIKGLIDAINDVFKKTCTTDAAADLLMRKHPKLFENKRILFLEWDLASLKLSVSNYYSEIFGREFIPFGDKYFTPEKLGIHPDDATGFNEWLKKVRAGKDTEPFICKKIMADGRYRYMEYCFVIECDEAGTPAFAFGYIMDVDRFIRKEIALKRAAELDRYSGAFNKYVYMEKLKETLERARKKKDKCYVGIMKLHNYFSLEEECLGAGEAAIKYIVRVISDNLGCTVGRILNDSVGIICKGENADFIWKEIIKELNLGFTFGEKDGHYKISATTILYSVDKLSRDVDKCVSIFIKAYKNMVDSEENSYYIMKGKK